MKLRMMDERGKLTPEQAAAFTAMKGVRVKKLTEEQKKQLNEIYLSVMAGDND